MHRCTNKLREDSDWLHRFWLHHPLWLLNDARATGRARTSTHSTAIMRVRANQNLIALSSADAYTARAAYVPSSDDVISALSATSSLAFCSDFPIRPFPLFHRLFSSSVVSYPFLPSFLFFFFLSPLGKGFVFLSVDSADEIIGRFSAFSTANLTIVLVDDHEAWCATLRDSWMLD